MITTCTDCGQAYEAGSEEQANEPTRWCPRCRGLRGIGVPLAEQTDPAQDLAAEACAAWLLRQAEHNRLTLEWQEIETRLTRAHDWLNLNNEQRQRFPEQAQMDALEARLDVLHEQNRRALRTIPELVASTPRAIMRKLEVAIVEGHPHDNEEANQLLKSILRDFRARYGD